MFSGWLKQEQGGEEPTGLDAAKKRVLGEQEEDLTARQRMGGAIRRQGEAELDKMIAQDTQPVQSPAPQGAGPMAPANSRFSTSVAGGVAPQFSLTSDRDSEQFKNADSIIDNLEQNLGGLTGNNTLIRNRDQLLSALKDPKRREKSVNMVQTLNQLEDVLKRKQEAMGDLDPNDDSQVVKFLEDHMGFRYHNGGLILPDDHNDVKRAFSSGLKNPNIKGGRMMSRQAFRQLFDPDTRNALAGNNLQEIAKNALKSGIPISKELSDELFKLLKSPTQYQNWAKEQGVAYLDPEDDIDMDYERLPNPETGEMEFTGMTGLDLLKMSDPESYYNQFSYNPRGMGRGKHLFHKNLMTMGNDWVTGANELLTPNRGTVDHIVSAGNRDADARDIESPLNLGISGSGTNFHKVDMGDNPSDLANYATRYEDDNMSMAKGNQIAGITGGLAKKLFGGKEENRDDAWLLQRVLKGDLAEPKQQFDSMPPIEEFATKQYNFDLPGAQQDKDPGNRFIKKLLDDPRGGNQIGQGLANMTTYYPREDHSNRKMTSWSGNPMRDATNWGEYKALHPFKTALALPGAYNNFPEFEGIEQQIREEVMSGRSRDKEGLIAKRLEAAKAAQNRRQWQAPLQSRGAAWTTGLIDNEEYISQLNMLLNKARDFGQSIGGPAVNELFDRGEESLEKYKKLIKEQWPEGRLPSVDDNAGWWDAMIGKDPVKKLASSSYGRTVLPRAIVDMFDNMYSDNEIDKRGLTGFDPTDKGTYSESTINLTANTVL